MLAPSLLVFLSRFFYSFHCYSFSFCLFPFFKRIYFGLRRGPLMVHEKKRRKIYLEVEFELAMDTFMEFIKTNGSHWHRDRDTIHLHAPLRFMLIFVVVVAVVVVGARKPNLQLISVANWVKIAWRLCVYATHLLRIRPVRPSICELLLVKQRAQSIGQFMEIIWAPPYTWQ